MPAMNDLLEALQDSPPTTEMELRSILDTTGYDLVMKEPAMEEAPEDMGPVDAPMEEPPEGEEAPPAELEEAMTDMLPPIMATGNDLSPRGRGNMRIKVARFAIGKDKQEKGERS